MNLLRCILGNNDCFKAGETITPRGVCIHSTGANNPNLRRYVQPMPGCAGYRELMAQLGENRNGNHWNRPGLNVCVHGFIGKLADGRVAAVQALPWNWRGWHAGNGTTRPSANNTHISFEICEDGLNDPVYFAQVYRVAVELTAMLCSEYGLDPLAPGVVVCHSEAHDLGMASNHADVMHWFPKFGKTMDDFRADVRAEMEEAEMTPERFDELMQEWLRTLAEKSDANWGAEWETARAWAEENGLIKGDGQGNKCYQSYTTRQAMVLFLYRLVEMLKRGEL